jgi:regulator of replication initiation timing
VRLAEQVEILQAEHTELRAKVAELTAKLEALKIELEKLRRERDRDSSNSGKPPSADTLTERAKQAEERLSRAERRAWHVRRPRSSCRKRYAAVLRSNRGLLMRLLPRRPSPTACWCTLPERAAAAGEAWRARRLPPPRCAKSSIYPSSASR